MKEQFGTWILAEEQLPPLDTPVLAVGYRLDPYEDDLDQPNPDKARRCVAMRFEEDGRWLWTVKVSFFDLGDLDGFEDVFEEGDDYYEVTHWMPLPELPQRSEA